MIETLYDHAALNTPKGFLLALLIGLAFGFVLERAGFGSSRRLAGIFYFRDMAVLKVMFSAVVTAMLGLSYLVLFEVIALESIYLMPTAYVAQIVGGLLFGVGFVMSGWCPGTAAVGVASGKVDAAICIVGVLAGSVVFNEFYDRVVPMQSDEGVLFAYHSVNLSQTAFAVIMTVLAVVAFWIAEAVEKSRGTGGVYYKSRFLAAFGVLLIVLAVGLTIGGAPAAARGPTADRASASSGRPAATPPSNVLLTDVEDGADHIAPEDLAERLSGGDGDVLLVDVRSAEEFSSFHIRGAVHVPLAEVIARLEPYRNRGLIVLYSNGMTHPAQARDELFRKGFRNAYILTDGLSGFVQHCLKPVSLRHEPPSEVDTRRIKRWRRYFLDDAAAEPGADREDASTQIVR